MFLPKPTPDGILGIGNYAMTMGLAVMGGQDWASERPWIPLALVAKVAFDTSPFYVAIDFKLAWQFLDDTGL